MACSCNNNKASVTAQPWEVRSTENEHLGSYRTEVEAAVAAARTPGATYRQLQVA